MAASRRTGAVRVREVLQDGTTKQHSFKQFKSYRDAKLPLAPLSLLIGANASGKSNAVEGIRFLSWLAEGRRLDDLMSAVQAGDQQVRVRCGPSSVDAHAVSRQGRR